jgi:hypothetical protein
MFKYVNGRGFAARFFLPPPLTRRVSKRRF